MDRPLSGPQSRDEWPMLSALKDYFGFKTIKEAHTEFHQMAEKDQDEVRICLIKLGYNVTLHRQQTVIEGTFHHVKADDDGVNYDGEALTQQQEADLLHIDGGYKLGDIHPTAKAL